MSLKNIVFFIALVTLFAFLGLVPLFDVDEGAFSEATREMLDKHDFITPWLNGQLRFDKPILIYWLQSISAFFLGLNAYAMRLPSALASAGWAVLIYRYARKYFDTDTGLIAVLILVSAVQLQLITRAAIADALLNFFLAGSLFAFFEYGQHGRRRELLLGYAFAGAGMLTKGPVAVVIPLAVMSLYLFSFRRWKVWINMFLCVQGWIIFAAINLPWYVTILYLHGMKYVNGFFLKHNINRFHSPMEGHSGSLWYYVPVLLVGLMPFTPLLIKAVGKDIKNRPGDDVSRFLWIWALFVVLFFSFSGTKLPHYVVYGYTPLLFLMAREYKTLHPGWYLAPAALFFAVLALVPTIAQMITPYIHDAFAVEVINGARPIFGGLFTAVMLGIALTLLLLWRKSHQVAIVATAVAMVAALQIMVFPKVAWVMQEPVRQAALFCRQNQIRPVLWRIDTPSFLFYYQDVLEKPKHPQTGDVVFTRTRYLPKLEQNIHVLQQAHGYTLGQLQ